MKKKSKAGRPTLIETQGEPNVQMHLYVPQSIADALKAAGQMRQPKVSPGTILAELACRVYGKKEE